jgi:methyl-accepting chemotaxis protein
MIEAARNGGGFVGYRFPREGNGDRLPKIVYSVPFQPYGWVLAGEIYIDDIDAIFWSQVWRISALIGMALLVVVGASYLIGRGIVQPITGMTAAMRKLAGGDTATVIPALERGDEVGAMAQSVQVFKDNMIEAERLRAANAESEQHAAAQRAAERHKVVDLFDQSVQDAAARCSTPPVSPPVRAAPRAHDGGGNRRCPGIGLQPARLSFAGR